MRRYPTLRVDANAIGSSPRISQSQNLIGFRPPSSTVYIKRTAFIKLGAVGCFNNI